MALLKQSTHEYEGLTQTGECYDEAIVSLKSRYDCPCLMHQLHIRITTEAPTLKDGSGRELRKLHDTVHQHLHALKSMEYEPSGSFITSLLKLKLDQTTMFERQKVSQDKADIPNFSELLKFLDLHAQASEAQTGDLEKKHPRYELQKFTSPGRSIPSLQSTVIDRCMACKVTKHLFYSCSTFRSMPHDQMISFLKSYNLCLNCFKSGNFARQCPSLHRCRRCQGLHHTLLHDETSDCVNAAPSDSKSPKLLTFMASCL